MQDEGIVGHVTPAPRCAGTAPATGNPTDYTMARSHTSLHKAPAARILVFFRTIITEAQGPVQEFRDVDRFKDLPCSNLQSQRLGKYGQMTVTAGEDIQQKRRRRLLLLPYRHLKQSTDISQVGYQHQRCGW